MQKDEVVVPITSARNHRDRLPDPAPVADGSAVEIDDDADIPTELHHQILSLLAQGYEDEMIARHLALDLRGLRGALMELAAHAGASNRFQLALRARELGWV